jgi:hypothetical protein
MAAKKKTAKKAKRSPKQKAGKSSPKKKSRR